MATADKKDKKPPVIDPIVTKQKTSTFTIFGILIISLASLGFSFWGLLQNKHEKTAAKNKATDLLTHCQTLVQKNQTQNQAAITFLQRQLAQQKSEPETQSGTKLAVQRARYYLEFAQMNQALTDNRAATLQALQAANSLLLQTQDTTLLPVQKALQQEIEAVNAFQPLDIQTPFAELTALSEAIEALPLPQPSFSFKSPSPHLTTTSASTKASTWRTHLNQGLETLKQFIVIKKDEGDLTLLTPIHAAMRKEQLLMAIDLAQWGLIHQNQVVYQTALRRAFADFQALFMQSTQADGQIKVMAKTLNRCQLLTFPTNKPVIGNALRALNALMPST